MPEGPHISVVIPVHNEEGNPAPLVERLMPLLGAADEVIFVDDGSRDNTWAELQALHRPGRIRLVRFRKNFGKAAALMAGFSLSRGRLVFTMDGDLQDDPAEIPRFLEKMEQGYGVVSGWKKKRHDPAGKVIPSRIFNWVVAKVTGVDLHDVNCGFKAFRGEAAREVNIWGELHRFIPVLLAHQGYRVGEIAVQHHPRRRGRSKYGFSRLFKGFFDLGTVLLITRYAGRPAHAFGFAAVLLILLSAVTAIAMTLLGSGFSLADRYVSLGWLPILLAVAALVSLAAGWLGELIVAQGRQGGGPRLYVIEEQLD